MTVQRRLYSAVSRTNRRPQMRKPNVASLSFEDQLVQYLPNLRSFARFLVRDADRADDLVNETALRALAAKHQFEPGTNLKAWLLKILRNHHINAFRRNRMDARPIDETIDRTASLPAGQVASIELKEVRGAMTKLSHQHREVLMLVGAAGLSHEETAEICRCAVGTVKSRLNRARTELRQVLLDGGHLPEFGTKRIERIGAEKTEKTGEAR